MAVGQPWWSSALGMAPDWGLPPPFRPAVPARRPHDLASPVLSPSAHRGAGGTGGSGMSGGGGGAAGGARSMSPIPTAARTLVVIYDVI
jgi:hypothetical protein